jgi:hypothetical protein
MKDIYWVVQEPDKPPNLENRGFLKTQWFYAEIIKVA